MGSDEVAGWLEAGPLGEADLARLVRRLEHERQAERICAVGEILVRSGLASDEVFAAFEWAVRLSGGRRGVN